MKIIETRYSGYRFRSRSEARWAVFFDAIGLPYEYEKEGYDLDGTWYLPDFLIPAWDCFVEIKGTKPNQEAIIKARLLRDISKKLILIVCGTPWPGNYVVYPFMPPDIDFDLLDEGGVLLQCRGCPSIYLSRVDKDGKVITSFRLGHPKEKADCRSCEDRDPLLGELGKRIRKGKSGTIQRLTSSMIFLSQLAVPDPGEKK